MKNKTEIYGKLLDLKNSLIPQSMRETLKHQAKVDIVSWVYNNGNIRDENEVNIKLRNAKEELTALQFINDTSFNLDVVSAKISTLQEILS